MGFRRAAGHLNHLAQIRLSVERLRQITEREGQRVMAAPSQGQDRHVLATAGDHTVIGRMIRRKAKRLGQNLFDQKLGLGDGADWILRQLAIYLSSLDQFILDFYHLSEHLWSASNACWGQATDAARRFAEDLLHKARHEGPAAVLAALDAECRKHPRGRKRQALQELIGYLTKRACVGTSKGPSR